MLKFYEILETSIKPPILITRDGVPCHGSIVEIVFFNAAHISLPSDGEVYLGIFYVKNCV